MVGCSPPLGGDRSLALLTARAAAGRLGIAYSTFKRWVRMGRVRTVRTEGGHHRVSESEIDRLIAAHDVAVRPTTAPRADDTLVGLSARNRLKGFVEEVRVDGLLAQVRLRIGDERLTAVVTSDAIRELKLKRGDEALAVIKSTEVMVARAGHRSGRPAARRRRRKVASRA